MQKKALNPRNKRGSLRGPDWRRSGPHPERNQDRDIKVLQCVGPSVPVRRRSTLVTDSAPSGERNWRKKGLGFESDLTDRLINGRTDIAASRSVKLRLRDDLFSYGSVYAMCSLAPISTAVARLGPIWPRNHFREGAEPRTFRRSRTRLINHKRAKKERKRASQWHPGSRLEVTSNSLKSKFLITVS
jgi:hypothetical protein